MTEFRKIEREELLGDLFPEFCEFFRTINLERFPEEKPWSDSQIIETTKQNANQTLSICAFDGGHMVACSRLGWGLCRPGYGRFSVNVLPGCRRQGLGSSIFVQVLDHALSIGLSKLICQTHRPSGDEFIANRGGEVVAKESTRTLLMSDVDWSLVDGWIAKEKSFAPPLSLVFSRHLVDSMIPGLATVSLEIERDLMALHANPLEISYEFEVEEWKRRQTEAASPNQSRIFLLVHDSSGDIVGYSNISIQNSDPAFARQGMTAVKKECRGAGIGKLIKASMLRFIRENRPEIMRVSTGNNDLNAPMVSINDRLGFIKGATFTSFAFDISKAVEAMKPKA